MFKFNPERRTALGKMAALAVTTSQALERDAQFTTATALVVARSAPPHVEVLRSEFTYQAELLFPERYNGQLPQIKGAPFVGQERLKRILAALDQTEDPLLKKVVKDIGRLSLPIPPADLPEWAGFERKPFPLTYNSSSMISSALHTTHQVKDPQNQIYIKDRDGNSAGIYDFDKVYLGVQIAYAPPVRRAGYLVEGIFLAKEVLTHTIMMRMAQEYHKLLGQKGVTATDASGNLLIDPKKIQRAGEMLWFIESGDDNSLAWKVTDTFPIALLATSMSNLIDRKKLDLSRAETLGVFRLGLHLLNLNPGIRVMLNQFSSDWVRSGSLLPPVGTTEQAFTHPYSTFMSMYQQEMRKRG